jgi:hypothetical protein
VLGGDTLRIRELKLNNFGKFHNKSIELQDGINVIYGDNEAGKSTIHSFIKGMLFGIDKLRGRASKDDTYLKYQPWDTPGSYNGSMDIEVDDKKYRIIRNFDKNNKECNVLDLETGRDITINPDNLNELFYGLTESGYRNTVSIEQLKARTDQELVNEVRNYITNLSLSKSNEVDVAGALSILQSKKKQLEAEQISEKLMLLEEEIANGLEIETKIDKLLCKLKDLEEYNKHSQLNFDKPSESKLLTGFRSKEEIENYLERFAIAKEKYRYYKESMCQKESFHSNQIELTKQLYELKAKPKVDDVNKQIEMLTKHQGEYNNSLISMNQAMEQETNLKEKRHRYSLILMIPVIMGILGALFLIGKNTILATLCSTLAVSSFAGILIVFNNYRIKLSTALGVITNLEKKQQLLQMQINEILKRNQVCDIQELRKKHEELIKNEIFIEQVTLKIEEYHNQMDVLDERINLLKKDISNILMDFPYVYEGLHITEHTIFDDNIMEKVEEDTNKLKYELQQTNDRKNKEQEEQKIQIEKLRWELSTYEGNEEKLLRSQELHKELLLRKVENDEKISAVKLAIDTIHNLSVDIHDSFGQRLNNYVSDLAFDITNGKYETIKIDEKLSVKVGSENRLITLDKLSAGTIEQLYFSMRMAISDLIFGEDKLPILLDDCFALYDDKRTKATLNSLLNKGKGQVILFTCHNREKGLLDELGAKYHYIELT